VDKRLVARFLTHGVVCREDQQTTVDNTE